jgi:GTPase SAR1 family protein
MKLAEALAIVDRLLMVQRGRRLEIIERAILTSAWHKIPYRDIDGYYEQTLKNQAVVLWKDLSCVLDTRVKKSNIFRILEDLHIDGAIAEKSYQLASPDPQTTSRFYGRSKELWRLEYAIESQRCRSLFMYGMNGIGKTTIARKLVDRLADRVERIIWISLQDAPPLIEVLSIAIKQIGAGRDAKLSRNLAKAIDKTIGYLQTTRCLLVLDDADPVLRVAKLPMPKINRDYSLFFARINEVKHQSCCLAIVCEKFMLVENYRHLEIGGLDRRSCQEIVGSDRLYGTPAEWDILTNKYHGNPQYMKIVALTIRDIFNGSIRRFLDRNIAVLDRIEQILSAQLDRLSTSEYNLIMWLLETSSHPIALGEIENYFAAIVPDLQVVKTLDKLVRKYLVEVEDNYFKLSQLIREQLCQLRIKHELLPNSSPNNT